MRSLAVSGFIRKLACEQAHRAKPSGGKGSGEEPLSGSRLCRAHFCSNVSLLAGYVNYDEYLKFENTQKPKSVVEVSSLPIYYNNTIS